jgi:hypothetical protein
MCDDPVFSPPVSCNAWHGRWDAGHRQCGHHSPVDRCPWQHGLTGNGFTEYVLGQAQFADWSHVSGAAGPPLTRGIKMGTSWLPLVITLNGPQRIPPVWFGRAYLRRLPRFLYATKCSMWRGDCCEVRIMRSRKELKCWSCQTASIAAIQLSSLLGRKMKGPMRLKTTNLLDWCVG